MTVATQVNQTLAGLKSAQASLETFALGTEINRQNNCTKTLLNKLNQLLTA